MDIAMLPWFLSLEILIGRGQGIFREKLERGRGERLGTTEDTGSTEKKPQRESFYKIFKVFSEPSVISSKRSERVVQGFLYSTGPCRWR
jgi:hypothetical protein